jgi:hypothetical protein
MVSYDIYCPLCANCFIPPKTINIQNISDNFNINIFIKKTRWLKKIVALTIDNKIYNNVQIDEGDIIYVYNKKKKINMRLYGTKPDIDDTLNELINECVIIHKDCY